VPKDIPFVDENGRKVTIGDYFGKRPLILMPVFYTCASACSVTLEEGIKSFTKMRSKNFALGKNYDVITFSIHPKEDHEIALIKKNQMFRSYKDPQAFEHWHFLTGTQESIQRLTKAIGFRYTYDPEKDRIQHPAGIMVLTPNGRLSRYFYGTQFEPKLLRDVLQEAASGQIGPKSEVLLFGCLHIDPLIQSFSRDVLGFMRLLGVLTLLILGGSIFYMNRKNRKRKANVRGVPTQ
jgi:protein SCO1/2